LTPASLPFYVTAMARLKGKQPSQGALRSALAMKIVERWGKNGGEVTVDRLSSELGQVQRYDIVAALKELERTGAGEFFVGRAGSKARFVWAHARASSGAASRKAAKAVAARTVPAARDKRITPAALELRAGAKRASSADAPRTVSGGSRASSLPSTAAEGATLEHVFHLRPGYTVTLALPVDVSPSEMERLCQFLQAIPFGAGSTRR